MSPDQAYELLQRLRTYFEKTLSTEAIREYLAVLRKLEYSQGVGAIERAIAELEFFPKIAKLNELARSFAPSEGQSPRGQQINISAFDFWAFVLHDKLSELDYGEYMRYCVDMEYRGQVLERWRREWKIEMEGQDLSERKIG